MKCKRVTRSVLASKLYGIAHGFDMGGLVKTMIDRILEMEVLLIVYIDSKSLYEYLVKLRTIREKRLMINVMCLR
jgi:hypothetical protein